MGLYFKFNNMVEEILRTEHLCKKFGKLTVLDDVSISFAKGEIFTLMGQSGVGKSVFIKLLIGLLEPDSGKIFFNGEDITNASPKAWIEIRKKMGMLFQNGALFDSLSVFDNVSFQIREHMLKKTDEELKILVRELLMEVGLKNIETLFSDQLSGGMQKRVALARTIALNPSVILYDEPITGLDPITASVINKLIKDLNKKKNITSIIVSHDIKSSIRISQRIGLLYKGKLVALTETENLKNYKNEYLDQFIKGSINGPIETILEEK